MRVAVGGSGFSTARECPDTPVKSCRPKGLGEFLGEGLRPVITCLASQDLAKSGGDLRDSNLRPSNLDWRNVSTRQRVVG